MWLGIFFEVILPQIFILKKAKVSKKVIFFRNSFPCLFLLQTFKFLIQAVKMPIWFLDFYMGFVVFILK